MAMVRRTKDGGSHEIVEGDHLDQIWCCLDCYWKDRVGAVMVKDTYRCPECNSANLHPADGAELAVDEYFGEIGTKN